jgi:hypothetical protein
MRPGVFALESAMIIEIAAGVVLGGLVLVLLFKPWFWRLLGVLLILVCGGFVALLLYLWGYGAVVSWVLIAIVMGTIFFGLFGRLMRWIFHARDDPKQVFSSGSYGIDPDFLPPFETEPEADITQNTEKLKRTAINADEIDKIVNILWGRFRAIATGDFYKLEEFVPKDPFLCFIVDVALVWTVIAVKLEIRARPKPTLLKSPVGPLSDQVLRLPTPKSSTTS